MAGETGQPDPRRPGSALPPEEDEEIELLLRGWRVKALYVLLIVIAVAGLPAYFLAIGNAIRSGQTSPALWAYAAVYVAFVVLAVLPRLDFRLRAWSLLLLCDVNAAASFARNGLAGSGRLYLIVVPILATTLIGSPAGYLTAALSLAIYATFALFAHLGISGEWLAVQANPLTLAYWIEAGAALVVFLVVVVVLLTRLFDLQRRVLAARRRAAADLERTTTALREREERFALAMQGTNDGLWDWDLRTNEVYFSPRWKAMLGYADEEIRGEFAAWQERLHPDDAEFVQAMLEAYLDGQLAIYAPEFRMRHKDGSYRWILARGIALRDADGKPYRMAGSHTDITKRRQTEEALQTAYQTLERRVAERTHALATLNAVASTVSRSLNLDAILSDALDKTLQVIAAAAGAAYRLEDASQTFVLAAQRGLPDAVLQISNRNPLVLALGGKPLTQAAPVIWDVATDYPPGPLRENMQAAGLSTVIGIPLVAKDRLVGCLALSTHRARSLSPEDAALLMAIGQQVGVATENARLYKSESEGHTEAERRQRVAEGMREILTVLNSRQSLPDILNSIVTQACRLLDCDAAALFRLGSDRLLTVQASCGLDREYTSELSLPLGRGGAGRALAEHRAVPLPDVAAYVEFLTHEDPAPNPEKTSLDQLLRRDFGALLAVPLVVRDEDYGAITLYYRAARDFSEEELRLALSVAHQAALAIESARLREQAQAAAALAERSRLARELHDSVTQSLYSVTLYAEAAARLLSSGQHVQAAEYLRDLQDTSQEALREMRLLVFELRPPALEQVGLAGALEARLKAVEARGGMASELRVEGRGPAPWLTSQDQHELYNIAHEALNNAYRHSRARRVEVSLHYAEEAVRLSISDDGRGFDLPAARECGGMGLTGMAERAGRIGADLLIDTRPGDGTRITVTMPLKAQKASQMAREAE